ncbi:MAG TPA: 7-cyano-7-deazaguanine synthase [Candidatus Binataceae bacterium]|nr:7-cyano-7-deazaguanine synthase [Candidatus Binataceae bacterium]
MKRSRGKIKGSHLKNFRITPIRSRVAVLASGGLDSSVLLADFARKGRRVFPIYIRAGLRWERVELATLRKFIAALARDNIEEVAVLDFPTVDITRDHWSVTGKAVPGYRASLASNYIPGRNLSLLTKAAMFCARNRIGEIAMAPLESNPFPDARPEFFRAVERAVKLGMELPLRVLTPFEGLEKSDVIRKGRALALELTLSCANPRGMLHCGACTKCAERIQGFHAAGIADPTRYANNTG